MLDISPETLAPLVDPIPSGNPAAWWVTDDPQHLAQVEAFVEAETAWDAAAEELAAEAGSDSTGIRVTSARGYEHLVGFQPVPGSEPRVGWRVDSDTGLLVPSKRTKADRESGSEERFQALSQVPVLGGYLTGIDRGFIAGNKFWPTQFYVRDTVIAAFVAADPEECTRGDGFQVDATWTRIPMSTFHLLRERKSAA